MWQSLPLSPCWDCEQNLYCSHFRRGLAEPAATSIQGESMTHISGQCRAGETVRMTARRGCAQPCHHSSQLSASTSCPSSYLLTSTPSLQAPTEQSARTPLHEEWASRTPGRVSMLSFSLCILQLGAYVSPSGGLHQHGSLQKPWHQRLQLVLAQETKTLMPMTAPLTQEVGAYKTQAS